MTNTATATVIPRKTRSDHFTDTGKSQPVSVIPRILSDIESNTRKLLAMFEAGIVHTDMVKSQIKASGHEAEKLQLVQPLVPEASSSMPHPPPPPPKKQGVLAKVGKLAAGAAGAISQNHEIADAVGLAIGGPIYGLAKEMMGVGKTVAGAFSFQRKSEQKRDISAQRHASDAVVSDSSEKQGLLSRIGGLLKDSSVTGRGGQVIVGDPQAARADLKETAGLAIGGPIYGIYKEFKEFGKTVVDAMPSKDEKGDLPGKKTGGRDEFGRFASTAKEQTGVSKDILAATKAVESAIVDSAPPEKTKQAAAVQPTAPDMLPTATAEVHPRQQESQNDIVKAIIHDIHHADGQEPKTAKAEVTQKDTRQKSSFKAATIHQPPAVPGAVSGSGSGGILGSVKQAAVDIAGAKTLGYLGKTRVGKMAMGAVEKVGNLRAATAEKAASLAGRATEGVFNVGGKILRAPSKIGSAVAEVGGKAMSAIGEGGGTIAKMLPAAGRLLEPLSAVAKVVGKVAGPLAAITAGYDAYHGYNDKEGQAKAFDLKKEDAATIGQKIAMAVATTMDKGTFGIFSGLGNMMGIDFKSALAKNVKDSVNPFSVGEQVKGVWTSIKNFGQAVTGTRTKENAAQLDAAEAKKADVKAGKYPSAPAYSGLGSISAKNESNGDPGMVNDNDVGKAAYGTFQMRGGEATRFIQQSKWANDFKGLKEGTPEFKQKWQATAGKKGSPQSAEFGAAQKARIKQTHYDPVAARAQELGIDTSSPAIQEAIWSTAVQHGGTGGGQNILTKAMSGVDAKTLSKADIITRINAERGRMDMNGNLVHFTKVKSEGGKKALLNRFSSENQQETAMAYNETKTPAVTPVATADVATAAKPQHIQTAAIETPVVRPQVQAFKPEAQKAGATSADAGAFFDRFSDYMKNNSGPQAGQRSTPSSQPQKTTSNIPMEFDDTLLTLMAYDRI